MTPTNGTNQGKPNQRFVERVDALVRDVQAWVKEMDWVTRRIDVKVKNREGKKYVVPGLQF